MVTEYFWILIPTLQSLARGGVSTNVTLEYQYLGSGEGRLCPNCITGPIRARACIGVSDGWPNNRVSLEAWYQIRSTRMCSRKVWSLTIVSLLVYDRICLYNIGVGAGLAGPVLAGPLFW